MFIPAGVLTPEIGSFKSAEGGMTGLRKDTRGRAAIRPGVVVEGAITEIRQPRHKGPLGSADGRGVHLERVGPDRRGDKGQRADGEPSSYPCWTQDTRVGVS